MYRKHYVQGCSLCAFALGLIVGYCLDSWLLCCGGGIGLLFLGLCIFSRRR